VGSSQPEHMMDIEGGTATAAVTASGAACCAAGGGVMDAGSWFTPARQPCMVRGKRAVSSCSL
jgi:hypothetical protein